MSYRFVFIFSFFYMLYFFSVGSGWGVVESPKKFSTSRVVVSPIILTWLYAGDRFLAANVETIRLSATNQNSGQVDMEYMIRAQAVVSSLNSCHEDNYYLANGFLTWGGAVEHGNKILEAAIRCRGWDYVPPFFYGVNLAFFQRDILSAQQALELSAQRSKHNAASLRKFAIMLRSEEFSDEKVALEYLIQQRDATKDKALRLMLDKRVIRLQGLVILRDAQRRYQMQTQKSLIAPTQLIEAGIIESIPEDPLRLGYEFVDGHFILKKLKIAGFED